MERTITVLGTGSIQASPDYLYINMTIEGFDKNYDLALKKGKKQLQQVSTALISLGFEADALKTMDFLVSTDYVRNADAHGRFKNDFNGYICRYRVRLGMDLDMKKAQNVLAVLQDLVDAPRTSLDFTVKDSKSLSDQVLRLAVQDAFERSDIITAAAGIVKGEILSIEYSREPQNFFSDSHYSPTENGKSPSRKYFHPNSIEISDTVKIIWAIQ